VNRRQFYLEHKEFIDDCMRYFKYVKLYHEVDAEHLCYELAKQNEG